MVTSEAISIPILKEYQDQLIKAFALKFVPKKTFPKIACGIYINEENGKIESTCTIAAKTDL